MKLFIPTGENPGVPITLSQDDDGEIRLSAGSATILWIRDNGKILLSDFYGDELRDLGFNVDDDGKVEIEE